ncbi:hypothetical protein NE237_028796 [Protea cynaroides]|uniref:Uncharacterized protein n=1 Tax=Protea cynaroides TaxID=273540 RepID=A0A9Q0JT78_9MAGN|nr:hypothetical protein NE237_028796 [Protea cynaroides]
MSGVGDHLNAFSAPSKGLSAMVLVTEKGVDQANIVFTARVPALPVSEPNRQVRFIDRQDSDDLDQITRSVASGSGGVNVRNPRVVEAPARVSVMTFPGQMGRTCSPTIYRVNAGIQSVHGG